MCSSEAPGCPACGQRREDVAWRRGGRAQSRFVQPRPRVAEYGRLPVVVGVQAGDAYRRVVQRSRGIGDEHRVRGPRPGTAADRVDELTRRCGVGDDRLLAGVPAVARTARRVPGHQAQLSAGHQHDARFRAPGGGREGAEHLPDGDPPRPVAQRAQGGQPERPGRRLSRGHRRYRRAMPLPPLAMAASADRRAPRNSPTGLLAPALSPGSGSVRTAASRSMSTARPWRSSSCGSR